VSSLTKHTTLVDGNLFIMLHVPAYEVIFRGITKTLL
jgi:hypothetical protein